MEHVFSSNEQRLFEIKADRVACTFCGVHMMLANDTTATATASATATADAPPLKNKTTAVVLEIDTKAKLVFSELMITLKQKNKQQNNQSSTSLTDNNNALSLLKNIAAKAISLYKVYQMYEVSERSERALMNTRILARNGYRHNGYKNTKLTHSILLVPSSLGAAVPGVVRPLPVPPQVRPAGPIPIPIPRPGRNHVVVGVLDDDGLDFRFLPSLREAEREGVCGYRAVQPHLHRDLVPLLSASGARRAG
tara:strand:+ start:42 stop:794 length:753 start_codon:yes stop_codon:yes gene_type:complete